MKQIIIAVVFAVVGFFAGMWYSFPSKSQSMAELTKFCDIRVVESEYEASREFHGYEQRLDSLYVTVKVPYYNDELYYYLSALSPDYNIRVVHYW